MQELLKIKNDSTSLKISKLVEIEASKTSKKQLKKVSLKINFTRQNLQNSLKEALFFS